MVVGPRAKIRPGRNIHTATAVHRMASPATEAKAMRRRLKSKKAFRGFVVRCDCRRRVRYGRPGLADGRNFRRGRSGDLGHAGLGHLGPGHLGLEQVAATGDHPDHLALVVAERSADFADALKQAVLADMDIRPGGFHQLLLAQDAAGILGEQPQYLQGLGSEPDRPAIGCAQLGAFRIELKTGKAQHVPSNPQLCPFCPRINLKNVPKHTGVRNIRKISECLNRRFRTPPPPNAMFSMPLRPGTGEFRVRSKVFVQNPARRGGCPADARRAVCDRGACRSRYFPRRAGNRRLREYRRRLLFSLSVCRRHQR